MPLKENHKTYLIAGLIGLVTISGAIAFIQYKKIMNYKLTFRAIKIKKILPNAFDFDLFLNFENKSKVPFEITKQSYDIYINNLFVSKIQNNAPTIIPASAVTPMGLNVAFNPKTILDKLGQDAVSLLTSPSNISIKIDINLSVKLWFFTVNIPYVYETTLKDLVSKKNV